VSAWHAVADSDAMRWVVKRGPTRALFRGEAYRRLRLAKGRRIATRGLRAEPGRFRDVRSYCLFVGHNKSGSSMLGGLLDAHPDAIVADEHDALQYVEAGFRADQIFWLLDRGSKAEARQGRVTARRLTPYSYAVPGASQGLSERPLAVGDTTTGTSTRRLGADPALLDRLSHLMGSVQVGVIQMIRNPFDPISVMMIRGNRTFRNSIDHYFGACERLVEIRRRVDPERFLAVRYETLVEDPVTSLVGACRFIGLEPEPGYLQACASIIRPEPDRSRELVSWSAPWVDEVEERIAGYDFLRGYAYGG
jgi:Sulfotransferase family